MISYLECRTQQKGNAAVFEEMMTAYRKVQHRNFDELNLDVNFAPAKAEYWNFLKENFKSDRAILVGDPEKIYRAFAVDSLSKQAIRFDFDTTRKLSDLLILDLDKIHMGHLSKSVSIVEALKAIKANTYDQNHVPTEPNYSEMLKYFEAQVS